MSSRQDFVFDIAVWAYRKVQVVAWHFFALHPYHSEFVKSLLAFGNLFSSDSGEAELR